MAAFRHYLTMNGKRRTRSRQTSILTISTFPTVVAHQPIGYVPTGDHLKTKTLSNWFSVCKGFTKESGLGP